MAMPSNTLNVYQHLVAQLDNYLSLITNVITDEMKKKEQGENAILAHNGKKVITFQKYHLHSLNQHLQGSGYSYIKKGVFYIPCDKYGTAMLGLKITDDSIYFTAYLCNKAIINPSFVDLCKYSTQIQVEITHFFIPENLITRFSTWIEEYRVISKKIQQIEAEQAEINELLMEIADECMIPDFIDTTSVISIQAYKNAIEEERFNGKVFTYNEFHSAYKRHYQILQEKVEDNLVISNI